MVCALESTDVSSFLSLSDRKNADRRAQTISGRELAAKAEIGIPTCGDGRVSDKVGPGAGLTEYRGAEFPR
jgi:hypothetical protein